MLYIYVLKRTTTTKKSLKYYVNYMENHFLQHLYRPKNQSDLTLKPVLIYPIFSRIRVSLIIISISIGDISDWNGADLLSSVLVSSAAILSETVVTGLRKWRVCDSRSPMYALMLAHLERRSVWVSHVTCTLPPNDTFSLCLCWNRFWAVFFGTRLRTRYECPLFTFLGRQHWVMTKYMRKWTEMMRLNKCFVVTEDLLMVAYILS